MKTIIIATDFSPRANNAVQYSISAALEVGYSLILFNLYNPSIHALSDRVSNVTLDELLQRQKERVLKACDDIKKSHSLQVSAHVATGNFLSELQHCIETHHADLVVMGMADKSLDQDLLGNTTTLAIDKLKFPVLAIPAGATYNGIKKILYAADILRGIQLTILQKVKEFAQDFGADVEVLHVRETIDKIAENDDDNLKMHVDLMNTQMTGINLFYKNVLSERVVDAIKDEMNDSQSDLLIMVHQKYGFWESVIHRSKTRVMASGNDFPLLSLPL